MVANGLAMISAWINPQDLSAEKSALLKVRKVHLIKHKPR